MKEFLVEGNTLPEAYHKALECLFYNGEITDCADWNTTQKEISMTIHVEHPLQEPMISKLFISGFRELEQYRMEMLDGALDWSIEAGKEPYTYHDRMVNYHTLDGDINQIDFVINELKRNPSSRRAVIIIRDVGKDSNSDDPACMQLAQYFIRNNKLDCDILFRSNDAVKATFMNAFALILIQKKIADTLGISVGTYTHRANSFHCYEKDYNKLYGYIKRIKERDDIFYNYIGEWDELMEECRPEIEKMMEELQKH